MFAHIIAIFVIIELWIYRKSSKTSRLWTKY